MRYILVVNASNAEKDWAHLSREIKAFDAQMENKSEAVALLSVQGPKSKQILSDMANGAFLTEPVKKRPRHRAALRQDHTHRKDGLYG